jgi:preprotein translocase subunit SecG
MPILSIILLVFFVLVAFLLVGIVLIQDEQGDGLAGMFGGGSTSTFGSRSGNVLTKTTTVLGALFIITALGLAVLFKTPDTGDVAAAARQAGAKANTEWWNAQPAAPVVAQPAAAADTTAPAKAVATPTPKPAAKN